MAKALEQAREEGLISSYSPDEAVGIVVNQLMFRKGVTRKRLGELLGITGANAGMKLRGEIRWTLSDLYKVSTFFGLELPELLPSQDQPDDRVVTTEQRQLEAGFFPAQAALTAAAQVSSLNGKARSSDRAVDGWYTDRDSNPEPAD